MLQVALFFSRFS